MLNFSKYNDTSPKLVYSQEKSGEVMREKFQPISMQYVKLLNQYREHRERAIWRPNNGQAET